MAFKIQDFECKDCGEVTEILLDSRDPEQKVECAKCQSTNVSPILSPGTGNKTHISWSKWRVSV